MPKHLQIKLDEIPSKENVQVFSLKLFRQDDIENGVYKHLGIKIQDGKVTYPDEVIPGIIGRFTKFNLYEKEIIRKDLPKEDYTISVEAPNWGDASNGTHTIVWNKKRYQREIEPAHGHRMKIKQIKNNSLLFEFSLANPIPHDDTDEIFFAINLLQESTGRSDLRGSDDKIDYTKIQQVDWEIFPPEKREDFVKKVMSGQNLASDIDATKATKERLDFMGKLKPKKYIYGRTGFGNYFGAVINKDLVVFENQNYGNAIYVLYSDWVKLSQLSRTELLRRNNETYNRVLHTKGWQDKVKRILDIKLK